MTEVLTEPKPADAKPRPAIELLGLTKRYGDVTAVADVTLEVRPGQVLGLLGPNGAGKTTTIKMMTGLVTPTSGTARLGGYDIGKQRSHAVRLVGAVLEGSRNVYWSLSAWQNLIYFGRLKGLRGPQIKPRAEQLLRDLGLWERRHEQVGGFSRGMQQKVSIAAALVTDPSIVLLDEPTIGLDVEAARTVREWVVRLAHDEGKAIVLTTHQLAMAEELSDRVAVIQQGHIGTNLPTSELLNRYVEDRFEVMVVGAAPDLAALPLDATLTTSDGRSTVRLPTDDQDALLRVLSQLRASEATIVGVSRIQPSLEDVFVKLVRGE